MNDIEFMRYCFKQNEAAVRFMQMIILISHVWDDLIDKDRTPSAEEIHMAFIFALTGMYRNDFFRANCNEIIPILENGIIHWKASNRMANGTDQQKTLAHFLRYSVADIATYIARVTGGMVWAEEVAPELQARMRPDSLEGYLKEHDHDR